MGSKTLLRLQEMVCIGRTDLVRKFARRHQDEATKIDNERHTNVTHPSIDLLEV